MARITNKHSKLQIHGIVGEVVIVNWKGGTYLRKKPNTVKSKRTEAQIKQQAKFSLMFDFLRDMNPFLKIGFSNEAKAKTALNAAMSFNLSNAIAENENGYYIDYQKVLLSYGSLNFVDNISVEIFSNNMLKLNWIDNSGINNALSSDFAIIACFADDYKNCIINTTGNQRSAGFQEIALPDNFFKDKIHLFLSFVSADKKRISKSRYFEIQIEV